MTKVQIWVLTGHWLVALGRPTNMTWGVTYGMVHRLDRLTLRGSQVAQVCVLVGNETPIRSVAVIVQGFTSGVLLWAPCSHLILRTLAQRSFVVGQLTCDMSSASAVFHVGNDRRLPGSLWSTATVRAYSVCSHSCLLPSIMRVFPQSSLHSLRFAARRVAT